MRSLRYQSTATITAIITVGNSPMPHITAPPMRWSSRAVGPQSRPMLPNQDACSRPVEVVMATPMKAWKTIVAIRSTSRRAYGGRRGSGSEPIMTRANRNPVSRKWTFMNSWPTWVSSENRKKSV